MATECLLPYTLYIALTDESVSLKSLEIRIMVTLSN